MLGSFNDKTCGYEPQNKGSIPLPSTKKFGELTEWNCAGLLSRVHLEKGA